MRSGLTERDVLKLLRERHPPPAWAFLEHVANATGVLKERTADAIAMSVWPSRGLELHGFEVKVHRSDWLRELKKPAKADDIASRCHRWWIAAGPKVVEAGELPGTWGLVLVEGKNLRVAKEAPLVEALPLDHPFLAALLRRAAQAFCTREEQAARRSPRGAVPLPTEADAARWMARLERLSLTASLIQSDVRSRLYELQHPRPVEAEGGED
jgi:hypothetical protein